MWYNKYENCIYDHLGEDLEKGIDCGNLIVTIFKQERNITIPYSTKDYCSDKDENWYNKIVDFPFTRAANLNNGWENIPKGRNSWAENMEIFDVVLMSLGATNCINHCALVVDNKPRIKLLHTMLDRGKSWVAPYGGVYENYTEGVYRWIGLKNIIN